MTSTSLLIISGAGLPDWIWDDATYGLDAAIAQRPDRRNATLRDYAQAALATTPDGPLTVVAHSAGGVVAAALTALAPQRVRGILGVTAVIPHAGRSFIGSMPMPNRLILSTLMRLAGTRPPASVLRSGLTAGLDPETSQRIVDDFVPESQGYYRDRAPEFVLPIHRGYITTTTDRELPRALQRGFKERLASVYEGEIEGGHLPMLEHPQRLRASIVDFQASVR